MIPRCSSIDAFSLYASTTLGVVLTLASCSSSEGTRPFIAETDGGDGVISDGGGLSASDAASDAGELDPPAPYDFAVTCASDPCVTQLAARGGSHACAVLQDGSVRCWGANASGQLGTGPSDAGPIAAYEARPRRVVGTSTAKRVSATGEGTSGTTCVVAVTGDVTCFGSDVWGQLGRGSSGSQAPNSDPALVPGLQAKSVTLASSFALAIGTDDRLWSWGTNDAFQLARTTSADDAGSSSGAAPADLISSAVRSYAGTSKTGFIVAEDGSLLSWGGGMNDQAGRIASTVQYLLPTAIALPDVSSVAAGAAHACAISRGRVYCWGDNENGQLGTGRKARELLPALVTLPADVYAVAVAAGGNNTCIIAADGDVHCWGANAGGQMGAGTRLDHVTPTRITGLDEQTVAVAIMDTAICALLRDGSVACWGDNLCGQLGRGSRDAEPHPQPEPAVFE